MQHNALQHDVFGHLFRVLFCREKLSFLVIFFSIYNTPFFAGFFCAGFFARAFFRGLFFASFFSRAFFCGLFLRGLFSAGFLAQAYVF